MNPYTFKMIIAVHDFRKFLPLGISYYTIYGPTKFKAGYYRTKWYSVEFNFGTISVTFHLIKLVEKISQPLLAD